eukprot:7078843-Prymnesium_polylepis.1
MWALFKAIHVASYSYSAFVPPTQIVGETVHEQKELGWRKTRRIDSGYVPTKVYLGVAFLTGELLASKT